MGKESPTKSALVLQVKKTCLKRCNERKAAAPEPASAERVGCTLGDMRKMIKDIYVLVALRQTLASKDFWSCRYFYSLA